MRSVGRDGWRGSGVRLVVSMMHSSWHRSSLTHDIGVPMTKSVRFLTAAVLCSTIAACGDSGTNDGGGDDENTVTASIDGVAFSGTVSVQSSYSGGVLTIGAVGANQRQINIVIPNATTTGNYDLGAGRPGVVTVTFGIQSAWTTGLTGGTGTVALTAISASGARGTFSLTAVPAAGTGTVGNKVVTNGAFDVKF